MILFAILGLNEAGLDFVLDCQRVILLCCAIYQATTDFPPSTPTSYLPSQSTIHQLSVSRHATQHKLQSTS
jgi:hypothetical protein